MFVCSAKLNVQAQLPMPEPPVQAPPPPSPPIPPPKSVSKEKLYDCVNGVLNAATRKRRRFLETVDLFVSLQDYDLQKYRRLKGVIKMPHIVRPNLRACVIGGQGEREEARANGLGFVDFDEVLNMKEQRKAIGKLAAKYDVFLAPEALMRDLNWMLAPKLTKERKYIAPVAPTESIPLKLDELKKSTKLWMKKETFSICVGHVNMGADELVENVQAAETQLIEKLKKGWYHVRALTIKSTMGPGFKLC
ncbi:hypothetical protein HPB50_001053 [Hyalomma asiaticum]|uniref:Uncharacterized protein n=1 Tax=Hyalomma asiaticum TaxID=266040 RepID=A0ACB7RNG3_HYAAI|nr:hypothetical protein HPB50_001053 [Hyalomma asiaticum]